MPGKVFRRLAPAIALVFATTLLAGVPGVGAAVTPRGNDDIPPRCGLNVTLVLDRSGSISNSDAEEEVRDSGTAFINGLLGTGSKAALVTFATSASVNVAPTDNLASVASAISAIPDSQFTGATNWEDALLQAKNLNFGTVPLPKPADLVVIVTDGDPTTYINDNTNSGGSTSTDDLDKAITQANAIKALGSHMFAVGVTTAPTTSNLIAISGPDQYPVPETSINKGDWTVVSIAGLEAAMRKIALELCDESVTVHKLIDGVPASAPWTFTATSEGTTPQVKATNNLGSTLPFEWESVQPVIATIVETPQAGYTLASVNPVKCYQEDGTTVVPTSAVVNGATLTVGPRDKIDCYYYNVSTKGTLTVTKVLSPANDPGKFNLRIDGATAGTGANVGNNGTTGAIEVNTGSHSIGETAGTATDLANYTSSSACLANGQTVPISNGSVSVGSNQNVVCTITNTRQTGTLTVTKVLSPANDPGKFNLRIDGATAGTGGNVGNGGTTGAIAVNTGSHSFAETAGTATDLANYTSSSACLANGQTVPISNGSVSVGSTQNVVCTITNTRQTGTLRVTKVLSPANDPGKFNLGIDGATAGTGGNVGNGGTTGAISVNTGSHSFAETAGTATDLANYTSSSACLANGQAVSISNGSVSIASGQNVVCTITNTRKVGSLTVTKDVQGGSGTFDFTVTCDGLEPTEHSITGDGQFIVEDIPTETDCTVTEEDDPLWNSSVLPADGTVTIHSGDSAVVAFLNSAKPDGITLDKKVNGADHGSVGDALVAHVGDTLTYTVVVTNNGQVPLTIDTLSDPVAAGFAAACPHLGSVLDVGDSFTCTYTVTATVDTKNVASVKGVDDLDRSVTASDSTYVDVIHPAVTIVKTANPTNPGVGDTVTFSYLVTNTGDALLTNLTVNDDILGLVGTIASLAPGASTTLTKTMVAAATSPTKNVGTIKGSDPLGLEVNASDDATITVVLPLVLETAKVPEVLGIELVAPAPAAPVVAPATLPRTGSDPSRLLLLGWIAFLAGLSALLAGSKIRRRGESLS